MPTIPKKVKTGDTITAEMWNQLIDYVERSQLSLGTGSGLEMQSGPQGRLLKVAYQSSWYLGVANGDIPARSGTSAGVGSVSLVNVTPTFSAGVLTAASLSTALTNYEVVNVSANTMTGGAGIVSGQYCFVQEYPSGIMLVTPMECS